MKLKKFWKCDKRVKEEGTSIWLSGKDTEVKEVEEEYEVEEILEMRQKSKRGGNEYLVKCQRRKLKRKLLLRIPKLRRWRKNMKLKKFWKCDKRVKEEGTSIWLSGKDTKMQKTEPGSLKKV